MVKKTQGKIKKIKDPNRPKRAMSPFFLYQNQERAKLKAESPELKATEVVKILSARWNEMSDVDKQPYKDEHEVDKVRYSREIENYVPPPNLGMTTGRRKKDPNEPKRALTAFIFFSNHMRPNIRSEFPDMKIPEIGKRLGFLWRNMDDDQRAPFRSLETDDKSRHERERAIYVETKAQTDNLAHGYDEEDEE